MEIGKLIKDYREKNKISQRQFAITCGVSNGYISMLEEGKNPKTKEPIVPSMATMKKIATAMGLTLNELMDAVDDMNISMLPATENIKENKNIFISYKDLPNGRARRGAEYTLRLRSGLQDFSDVRERLAATKALVTGEQTKMADVRRNGITVINLCNSKTKKLCSKISKLDDSDLDKTVGFVEGLLAADKYQNAEDDKK